MTSPSREQQAAALHHCTHRASHPDSVEAVQRERQRVAQELQPFERHQLSIATSYASSEHQLQDTSLRTRPASNRNSTASREPLQRTESLESYATTQADVPRSRCSSIREQHWYSPIVKFWTTHVRYGGVACFSNEPTDMQ